MYCPQCQGEGHVEEESYCTNCAGSGEGQYDGARCTSCKGSGIAVIPPCPLCNGEGTTTLAHAYVYQEERADNLIDTIADIRTRLRKMNISGAKVDILMLNSMMAKALDYE